MKKIFIIISVIIILYTKVFAQELREEYEIVIPNYKIPNSLYHSIRFVDSRIDTSNIGIVQVGLMNNKAKVFFKTPFVYQLQNVLNNLTDSTAKSGELLFQLRQFSLSEITGAFNEKGFCTLRALLYSKDGDNYKKLANLDTFLIIKSFDVTKPLYKNSSKLIIELIADNLLRKAKDSCRFTLNEIIKIDSLEKRRIKIYNTDTYVEGLYYNYNSFKNQVPDEKVIVKTKKDSTIDYVSVLDTNNKYIKAKPKDMYSVVYNGKPYITTKYGYYPLYKLNDKFYFIGRVEATADQADVMGAAFLFGITGAIIASVNGNALYFIVLDHTTGRFILIKQMKE